MNAPGSYTPWCPSLLGYIVGCLFHCYAGKGKCCMWPVHKVEIYFAKIGFVDSKWSNLNAPGSYTHCSHSVLGFTVHIHPGTCVIMPVCHITVSGTLVQCCNSISKGPVGNKITVFFPTAPGIFAGVQRSVNGSYLCICNGCIVHRRSIYLQHAANDVA